MTRQGLDNKLVDTIEREIMQEGSPILWDDIAGLEYADGRDSARTRIVGV